jgi:hypothetical protein
VLILGAGLLFIVIGMVSFFSAFGGFEPPHYFWCCFVGMPLAAVGGAMTSMGFMGAVTRYQAAEVAPVGKDTANYVADGIQPGVKTMAKAITSGLSEGLAESGKGVFCTQCGGRNDSDAKFCKSCGHAIV